ncbi:MAG TPA: HD domain-containing protein [Ktedonobacterales bacterium]|nr:HD domain-containing protein [Ktedonobacterales bacterium]
MDTDALQSAQPETPTLPPNLTSESGEERLRQAIAAYMPAEDVAHIEDAIRLALRARAAGAGATDERATQILSRDFAYVLAVAQTLAESLHIDAITLAAVLLDQVVEARLLALDEIREELGGEFGEQVTETIASLERFDALQRPAVALRRSAQSAQSGAEPEDMPRERRRGRARQRQQDADALRKMFVAMAEDPRVVVIKIADRLRLMREAQRASDLWRARERADGAAGNGADSGASDGATPISPEMAQAPALSLEECRLLAQETREIFAPLAGRLGMGRVEGELEDLAFAILEPDEYAWLREAVAEEAQGRSEYVRRVIEMLREEMRKIGIEAEISGRVKHLYSIYKKVQRTGNHDLSTLYDILAFRIIVGTIAECYLALGHVHELWRPKDGRIKDFIASPKPNGYQSLHTTVFCLGDQLAEIQIRTREMHEMAEYGVAMHWYYKDVGDEAKTTARPLQSWVQQVKDWQQELHAPGSTATQRALEAVKGDVLREQIYVFTPAGDAKELPAGSTPLDFAFRVHTDLGLHVAGVRITSDDGAGRLSKKLVPLDYVLKNGDVIEILKRNDAHPTRDWLKIVHTKVARDRILKYLKGHERDIDLQMGRERLDRELRALGLRKGFEDFSEDDLEWLASELKQPDGESLLVALGADKLRMAPVLAKLRERLRPPEEEKPELPPATQPMREPEVGVSVEGMGGMMTRLATCCSPLPGDELYGFVTRGRGVVIHRADCPNLRALLARQPERGISVNWPRLDGGEKFRAPIIVEGTDRTGLLRDVTGVISGAKINMLRVEVATRHRPERAVINAVLEIRHPDELESILREIRGVSGVLSAERREPTPANKAASQAASQTGKAPKPARGRKG